VHNLISEHIRSHFQGRNTRDNSSLDDETERKYTSGQADSNPTTDDNNSVNVLLGASNFREITFYLVYCMCKININLVMITFRLCNVVCT
jgi:hypothetical protein